MPIKISILGSCVSRDLFNDESNEFEVVNYSARTSMGSLFALPFESDFWSEKIKSKFQKRMVNSDFKKTSAQNFLNKEADIYLIDLIDERFHLVEPSKGVRFTLSAELNEVMEDDYLKFRIIRQSSDEYMKLWKEGWYKLVEELNLRNNLEKVLIHKVLWLKETES